MRLADVGPVAAGFWRLALALPFLWLLARSGRPAGPLAGRAMAVALVASPAFFFAADLAAWHAGIHMTKLGNATLFGNFASFAFAAYGFVAGAAMAARVQGIALVLAAVGAALLIGGSAELSRPPSPRRSARLLAGLLYTFYLIAVERARGDA